MSEIKKAIVTGAGGFIGGHMVTKLKELGYYVIAVDIKKHQYKKNDADEFKLIDLRDAKKVNKLFENNKDTEIIFNFARVMGGAGVIFVGDNDSKIMHDSASINLNVLEATKNYCPNAKIFYSSSRCIYPEHNQLDPNNPNCKQETAWPANPDSCYGVEKIFSQKLYQAYRRNYGIKTYIARFHNIQGPLSCYCNGAEKAPAATCRKVLESIHNGTKKVQVWGLGDQTRSFLYIDECIEGVLRLVDIIPGKLDPEFFGPVNIGSDEMISINDLTKMVADIAGEEITIENVPGPTGVRGRNSDNTLIKEKLGWAPSKPLRQGMEKTFKWIKKQLNKKYKKERA